jgi:hypothetical protein
MSMALTNDNVDTFVRSGKLVMTPGKRAQLFVAQKWGHLRNGASAAASAASFGLHQVSVHTARKWISGGRQPCAKSIEILAVRCEEFAEQCEQERRKIRELIQSK